MKTYLLYNNLNVCHKTKSVPTLRRYGYGPIYGPMDNITSRRKYLMKKTAPEVPRHAARTQRASSLFKGMKQWAQRRGEENLEGGARGISRQSISLLVTPASMLGIPKGENSFFSFNLQHVMELKLLQIINGLILKCLDVNVMSILHRCSLP